MKILRSVQYLRAIAALSVLLFHVTQRGSHGVAVGAAGVDVFFIISGFIMATITDVRPTTPMEFLRDRLIRIAPSYWIVSLLMVALAAVIPSAFPNFSTPISHILLSLAFVPHDDPLGQRFPVLVPGWTLNYEMFFYTLMALALPLPKRWRLQCVTVVLLGLVGLGVSHPFQSAILATYTNPILLEFAAGTLLGAGWFPHVLPRRSWGWTAIMLGASTFLVQAVWPDCTHLAADPAGRLVVWGVPAFFLVAGAVAVETHGGIWTSRLGLELGGASYAVYLLHGLVVSTCWKILKDAPLPIITVLSVLSTIIVGVAFHRLVELPVSAKLRDLVRMLGSSLRRATPVTG